LQPRRELRLTLILRNSRMDLKPPSRRFVMGVLWHPEAGEDKRLFEELVREAGRYRSERSA